MDLVTIFMLLLGDEAPKAPQAPDVDRPALSSSDIKALRDANIFAPYGPKRKSAPSSFSKSSRSEPAAAPKPKAPVVTGIFFDAKADTFIVVVEDKNSDSLKLFKEPKFLKAGDEVVGYKVSAITADKATFLKGDVSKDLKVGEAMPGADGKAVSVAPATDDSETAVEESGEPKVEIKPQDAETNTKTLDEMRKKVGKKNRPSRDE